MAIQIREFSTETDSLSMLTRLLNRAYAALAEQGLRFTASYQDDSETQRRIDGGTCFVAVSSIGELVGTILVKQGGSREAYDPTIYHDPTVWIVSQFGVDPDFKGQGIGRMLFNQAESLARESGAHSLALDTSEKASDLIALYTRWGFSVIAEHQWPSGVNYRSVVMSKPLA